MSRRGWHIAIYTSLISSASGVHLRGFLQMRACALARFLINPASGTSKFAIRDGCACDVYMHICVIFCTCTCVLPSPHPSRFFRVLVKFVPRMTKRGGRSDEARQRRELRGRALRLFASVPTAADSPALPGQSEGAGCPASPAATSSAGCPASPVAASGPVLSEGAGRPAPLVGDTGTGAAPAERAKAEPGVVPAKRRKVFIDLDDL